MLYIKIVEQKLTYNNKQSNRGIVIDLFTGKDNSITIESSDLFLFYAHYTIRSKDNFDKVEFGRENFIDYSTTFFPLSYYIPIENDDNDISINLKFTEYAYKEDNSSPSDDEDLIVYTAITDEYFIKKRKKNPTLKPDSMNIITEAYDQGLRMVRLSFTSANIKNYAATSPKYIFILINQKDTNKKTYTKLSTQVIALPVNTADNHIPLPYNHYYYGTATPSVLSTFLLVKHTPEDTLMEIEYSSSLSNDYDISINLLSDDDDTSKIDYRKNTTSIIKGVKESNGKSFIEIELIKGAFAKVILSVFKKNHNKNLKENAYLAIKYQTGSQSFNHLSLRHEALTIEQSTQLIKVGFEPIVD